MGRAIVFSTLITEENASRGKSPALTMSAISRDAREMAATLQLTTDTSRIMAAGTDGLESPMRMSKGRMNEKYELVDGNRNAVKACESGNLLSVLVRSPAPLTRLSLQYPPTATTEPHCTEGPPVVYTTRLPRSPSADPDPCKQINSYSFSLSFSFSIARIFFLFQEHMVVS